jgi:hypothetical protein
MSKMRNLKRVLKISFFKYDLDHNALKMFFKEKVCYDKNNIFLGTNYVNLNNNYK